MIQGSEYLMAEINAINFHGVCSICPNLSPTHMINPTVIYTWFLDGIEGGSREITKDI